MSIKLVEAHKKEFSRANLIAIGVENYCANNSNDESLLFFCDVDILFNQISGFKTCLHWYVLKVTIRVQNIRN